MTAPDKITAKDLVEAMAAVDVLETFCRLPQADQDDFSRWVGQARDEASHWRRISALVLALRSGSLESRAAGDHVHSREATG